jgi:OOP family OmpA-OmpF porin
MNLKNSIFVVLILVFFVSGCGLLNSRGTGNSANTAVEKPADPTPTNTATPVSSPENAEAGEGENLLSLANGAYLLKQPNSLDAFDYSPINVISGGMMWRSTERNLTDNVFLIETPGETTLKKVGFGTKHPFYTSEENAKDIVFEVSNEGPDAGFKSILETSLPKDKTEHSFPVTSEIPGRWFRLTVKNNHGSTEATALTRISGFGTQKPAEMPQGLTGTYRPIDSKTGKVNIDDSANDLIMKQEGSSLVGCWREGGTFSGGLEGTVAKLKWQQPMLGDNSGLMIFTGKNNRLFFWRLKSGGFWAFEEFERTSATLGKCEGIDGFGEKDTAKKGIADDLEKSGRAVVYGINFDFNSDKLRPESKVVLDNIVSILKEKADWKMSIEGHTDNIGGAAFNQTLSEKRAASVKSYLVAAGIDESRLSSKGLGLTAPIEPNDTEFGRAKNRRVELTK